MDLFPDPNLIPTGYLTLKHDMYLSPPNSQCIDIRYP